MSFLKNAESSNKKILIIDDEEDILNLLETVFKKEGFNYIYKAANGYGGIKLCREISPDIIILDVMLPDIDGYNVCKKIREFFYAPIIFLSAKSDDSDKIAGLNIGGDDYVTKPFSPKELVSRVNAHFRRDQYMGMKINNTELIKIGNIKINKEKMEVTKNDQPVTLTAKEYQLLVYMAMHPNQILSKKKICDEVWADEYVGYDNTIMVHIRHLREKIEDEPAAPKIIVTIKGLGYRFNVKE